MTARIFLVCFILAPFLVGPFSAEAAVEYTGKAHPDPFLEASRGPGTSAGDPKNLSEPKLNPSGLSVQGIVVSPDGNLAIIKGKVARIGDTIQGFRVQAIETDGVVFSATVGGELKLYKITHKGQAPS